MSKNTCCTYFRVTGDFDPDLVTERLGLQPDIFWKIGDKRRNGTEYDFASWEIGHCEEYDVLTKNQSAKSITLLLVFLTPAYTTFGYSYATKKERFYEGKQIYLYVN